MPKEIQDRPMVTASVLGAVGTFSAFRGLSSLSEKYMSNWFNEHVFSRIIRYGVIAVPLTYGILSPETAMEVVQNHPTYTAGVGGCVVGGIGAACDHNKRIKDKRIRGLIKKIEEQERDMRIFRKQLGSIGKGVD